MTREQATKELIKYKGLKGKFSSNFFAIVEDVFVSYDDQIKARKDYESKKDHIITSKEDKIDDEFIVWAKFDKLFVPVKYVEVEKEKPY